MEGILNGLKLTDSGQILEGLSTDVFRSHGRQPEVYFLAFSTFSRPNTELQSAHFIIDRLAFSSKREYKYALKRRNFELRLTFVAQRRLCLNSLIFSSEKQTTIVHRVGTKHGVPHGVGHVLSLPIVHLIISGHQSGK